MGWPRAIFALVSVLLLIVATFIFRKQRNAKTCPRHQRMAGPLAWSLLVFCILASVALLWLALLGLP